MTKRIEIEAQDLEQITVNLVGTEYLLTPPKAALAISFAEQVDDVKANPMQGMKVITEWLESGFGKPTATKIMKRMKDPKDKLDLGHVNQLLQKVMEMQTDGNPTG